MAYISEEKKVELAKIELEKQKLQRRRLTSRDMFLMFFQQELGISFTPEQKSKFLAYIDHRIEVYKSCVLYTRSENVRNMLANLGISERSFGMKEFIIGEDFFVRYSPDYQKKPLKPLSTFWGVN